ncbi:hypothetical protein OIU77_016662 [Salix suchowensis]|uniref:Uncharacterized protein n=1 Tax=Salix suchowensis TaxID=1278906 RepID=A0ABQ8ZLC5_9ROSI|nr:hypothetical protein OIU77_016662 [Salix suchowensis]
MKIPYIGTHEWIESLNLTIKYDWEPWFVDGQVAGIHNVVCIQCARLHNIRLEVCNCKGRGSHSAGIQARAVPCHDR